MHLFENALSDFINAERVCAPGAVVVFDDVFPNHPRQAERVRQIQTWTGDVWKMLPILGKYRPDLTVLHVDCPPTGVIVCAGLTAESNVLAEKYDEIVKEFSDMSLREFGMDRLWGQFQNISGRRILEHPGEFLELLFARSSAGQQYKKFFCFFLSRKKNLLF